jgi:hypothetical protein
MLNLKRYYDNMWVPINKGPHTNIRVATIFHLAPKDQLVQQMLIASAITRWYIATSLTLSSLITQCSLNEILEDPYIE